MKTRKGEKSLRRGFKSAGVDRLNYGFQTVPEPLDQNLKSQLVALTTRARWLALNDDYVRRYIKISKNNIVGPRGIELRCQYRNRGGEPDMPLIEAVEEAWKDWGRRGVCDVSGKLSWVDCQNLFIEHIARDGEGLVVHQPRGRFGSQVQFMDPLVLGTQLCKILDRNREIVLGVEIDRRFRTPLAYWIHVNDSNQPETFDFDGRNYRRLPADFVLHCYRMEQVIQTRGFSPLSSAIQRLKMLNGYEDAALVAARAGASRMGFYKQEGDGAFEGDDEESDEDLLSDFEPGSMTKLPRGWGVEQFNTNWPNVDHADYVKSIIRGIASGIGVSYNTLANDLEGVNFSSIRAGVLEDREEWKSAQTWVAETFCQPIFESWLDRALSLGLIRIRGQAVSANRFDELRRVTWQGRRWDWVDPLKDIKANTEAINYRIRSISDVIREQGRDPDEVFEEIKRERSKLAELGIDIEVLSNDGNRIPNPGTADEES